MGRLRLKTSLNEIQGTMSQKKNLNRSKRQNRRDRPKGGSLSPHQIGFLEGSLKTKGVRDCISSPREFEFKQILEGQLNLVEDVDFKHQFAFHNDEMIAVVDFYFPKLNLVVELDGGSHRTKTQIALDKLRDRVLAANRVDSVRIKTPFNEERLHFWVIFLRELFNDVHEPTASKQNRR